jgi:hypothetical protein
LQQENAMSFDLFVNSFQHGKPAPFSIDILEKAFGRFADRSEEGCWRLTFPDGGETVLFLEDGDEISDFNVNGPTGSLELWQGLFDILKQTPSVLYWPGDGAVVVQADAVAHLPADMVPVISPITVVGEPAAIPAAIAQG